MCPHLSCFLHLEMKYYWYCVFYAKLDIFWAESKDWKLLPEYKQLLGLFSFRRTVWTVQQSKLMWPEHLAQRQANCLTLGFTELVKHLCRMQHVMQLFVVFFFMAFRPFKDVYLHMRKYVRKYHLKFILFI